MSAGTVRLARAGEHRSSLIVTALSAAFGVGMIEATSFLAAIISGGNVTQHKSAQLALLLVASVFIVIAIYVAAIVTANTFATIIAGRSRTIALLRLVGSSARTLRRSVAREGLAVGVAGSLVGAVAAVVIAAVGSSLAAATATVPVTGFSAVDPVTLLVALLPVVFVVLATWAASWVGSRKVLRVTPMQATGAAQEATREETLLRPVRNAVAVGLFFGGLLVLALGVLAGLVTMLGFLIAFAGGLLSFSGLVAGAHLFVPKALEAAGWLLGRSPAARLAAANALRYPERSTRTAIGLVIGVTLITTFVVAAQGYIAMIENAQRTQPEVFTGIEVLVQTTVTVFSVLIGFSALIASFGMVNNLSLSVLQRTRELGLLRALGFTVRQVRGMIVAESAQLTMASVGFGVILGVVYGWAGAQSLLGRVSGKAVLLWPGVPWSLVAVLLVAAVVLTAVASLAPARRATRVSPVAALAIE